MRKLASVCNDWANAADARTQQISVKARQAKNDLQAAHDLCQAGSGTFSFFGGRSGRSMRHFLDQIRAFAGIRLQEDLADATARFYRALRVCIEERLRELAYCRTRIDQLIQAMESPLMNLPASSDTPVALSEESLQQTLHPTNTLNVVLPSGDRHIERAAAKVVKSVKPQDVLRLEIALQKLVLEPRGGLSALCSVNADMSRTLVAPMVEQTTAFLSDLLPVTDVTEVEVSNAQARKMELPTRIQDYHTRSAPPCGSGGDTQTFVLVPDTDSGQSFASIVKRTVPNALTIAVNGAATDLMFCREHGNLRADEVATLLAACQPAYYQSLASPLTTPHARFDVTEWLPLVD
jgi:eukaryotic-like serine/threonine-protein kinase